MTTLVRFAPSPTGFLHVGNARTAILNWLYTQAKGGDFMLRLDDTDEERSREEYTDAIKRDLTWLGVEWKKFDRQSLRYERYLWAFETMKASGRLYACYETPEELDIKRKIQLSRGKPPIYDRAALKVTDAEKKKYEAEGRIPHWRFFLKPGKIRWQDQSRGEVSFEAENLTDPVLFRADMKPIYMLASTVDDIDHGITDVIRGEDHITNTAIMIQICEALGGTPPTFAHVSLLALADGEKLSKRKGSMSLQSLRDDGIEPLALISYLAKIGSSDPIEVRGTMEELVKDFDIAKYSRATPKFDYNELQALNAKLLHQMPYERIRPKLEALKLDIQEPFWNTIRANLKTVAELNDWALVIHGPVQPVIHDQGFAAQAADLLPPEPWDEKTWTLWTGKLKDASGRKGKDLFMPIRLALTGMEHGPELPRLLPLLGYKKTHQRLQGKAA